MRGASHWPAIVFLLTRGPRTIRELRQLTGASENGIHGVIKKLEDEGLVEVGGFRKSATPRPGSLPNEWRWVEPPPAVKLGVLRAEGLAA